MLIGAAALGVVALVAWKGMTRPRLPPAERGRRIAERNGCFACHGPEGTRGTPNPGRTDRTVPTFEGDLMMYAASGEEIREWIRDGVPRSRAKSRTWREQRERGAIAMPAFGERLSAREINDLAAFVRAVNGWNAPEDSLAQRGRDRAEELGCFGCHGAGGRLARRNPGSFKGYVPSWEGADFPELVRDRAEFAEWVERGISQRFEKNPLARFFLRRAALHMPAYAPHLRPGDLEALWAYVRWLRSGPSPEAPAEAPEDRER